MDGHHLVGSPITCSSKQIYLLVMSFSRPLLARGVCVGPSWSKVRGWAGLGPGCACDEVLLYEVVAPVKTVGTWLNLAFSLVWQGIFPRVQSLSLPRRETPKGKGPGAARPPVQVAPLLCYLCNKGGQGWSFLLPATLFAK
jgi:hypothetical protein